MPAKILSETEIVHLIRFARNRNSMYALRDATIIAVSIFAGLRAAEIAALTYNDVTTPTGALAGKLEVRAEGAKYGKARPVPIRPPLDTILMHYISEHQVIGGYLFDSFDGERIKAGALQQQYRRIAIEAGFTGVSSHSGRRTYITTLAKTIGKTSCTLIDVQILAGHACLNSTERYIEPSGEEAQLIDQAFNGLISPLAVTGEGVVVVEPTTSVETGMRRGSQRSGGQTHHARVKKYRTKRMAQALTVKFQGDVRTNVGDPANSQPEHESPKTRGSGRWDMLLQKIVWKR